MPKPPEKRVLPKPREETYPDADLTPREIPPPRRHYRAPELPDPTWTPRRVVQPPPAPPPDPFEGVHGKALFIRNARKLHLDPEEAAERYFDWGFDWACIPILWGDGRRTNRDMKFWRALHRLDVPTWPMVYLHPKGWRDQVQETAAWAAELGCTGVVLDVEREFRGAFLEDHERVAEVVGADTKLILIDAGLRFGFTSYGATWNFHDFPWHRFAKYVDVAIPQAYDASVTGQPGFVQRCLDGYDRKGFDALVVGGGLWNRKARRSKSRGELEAYLQTIPPVVGTVFWGAQTIPRFQLELLQQFNLTL